MSIKYVFMKFSKKGEIAKFKKFMLLRIKQIEHDVS